MVTCSFHLYFRNSQFILSSVSMDSFHRLMNSINCPALHIWVFIAQLVEHCSANAEATGSNPVEAPTTFFFFFSFRILRNCSNCDYRLCLTRVVLSSLIRTLADKPVAYRIPDRIGI